MVDVVTEEGQGFYYGLWFASNQMVRQHNEDHIDFRFYVDELNQLVGLEGIIDYLEAADDGNCVEECIFKDGSAYILRVIDLQHEDVTDERLAELTKGAIF